MTKPFLFNDVTLVCEANSWLLKYVELLHKKLKQRRVRSVIVHTYSNIQVGEAAFFKFKGKKYQLNIEDIGSADD